MTNEDKLIKYSIDGLDTDVSPDDLAKDELGCAESVCNLIKKVYPDFPILLSTKDLATKLDKDPRFKRVDLPNRGRIIVSPRTDTKFGHCGIFITNEKIASNTSFGVDKGKFVGNYTYDEWVEYFKSKIGLRIFLYELID